MRALSWSELRLFSILSFASAFRLSLFIVLLSSDINNMTKSDIKQSINRNERVFWLKETEQQYNISTLMVIRLLKNSIYRFSTKTLG